MSWSVTASGKASDVRNLAMEQFAKINYLDGDEEVLKDQAMGIVYNGLVAQDPDSRVKVECSGSHWGTERRHRLSITIEPVP